MSLILLLLTAGFALAADPALAIIEKASGHVGFFDLRGMLLKEFRSALTPTK